MTTPMGTKFYLRPGVGFTWRAPGEEQYALPEGARPLVVIDPEDREQVERFREIASRWADEVPYSDVRRDGDLDHTSAMQAALREFANPTLKPEEPTDPAVRVRAGGTTWAKVGSWWVTPALDEHPAVWDHLVEQEDFRVE